jgi:hypothetical protein
MKCLRRSQQQFSWHAKSCISIRSLVHISARKVTILGSFPDVSENLIAFIFEATCHLIVTVLDVRRLTHKTVITYPFSKNTPHYTTTLLISMYIFPPEDGHKTETCSGY